MRGRHPHQQRDQLEHAIQTACQITGKPEVIVVGSQSILGTFREEQLPADATIRHYSSPEAFLATLAAAPAIALECMAVRP